MLQIMIRPSKFALSFTFGSMCLMTAFAMLKGPAAFLAGLLEPKRLALTTAYFFSLGTLIIFPNDRYGFVVLLKLVLLTPLAGATLYSCLVLGNYILVVCSSVMQVRMLCRNLLMVERSDNTLTLNVRG